MSYLLPFGISLIFSLLLTLAVKKIASSFSVLDKPGLRKIHSKPIPLLGGLAVFISFFATLFIFYPRFLAGNLEWSHLLGFFIGGLFIAIGGFLDDKYNLPPKVQIIFPLLSVLAVILGGVEIEKITNPLGGLVFLSDLFPLGPILIALWLLGMMYTTKLLDGVDGLVTGIGAIGSLIIFLFTITTNYFQPDIALAAIILTGSALGFLIFNFYPAKIFLGEIGSLFFGYVLGVLSIISGSKIAIALLIMGIPILDVFWTILRRSLQGKNPFRFADNKHLHHRLLSLGLSQRQTVLVFYFLSAIFGASGLFLQSKGKFFALLALLFLMIFIVLFFHYIDFKNQQKKPSLLLHICCAPCGTYITKHRLMPKYRVTWFFYNSNLSSKKEYDKRLYYVKKMAKKLRIPLIVEPYNHKTWLEKVKGRESDKEGGRRCSICYLDRLNKTAKLASEKNFDIFGTTLLVSPYKNREVICQQGEALSSKFEVKFLSDNFRSDDGYQKSQKLARDLDLYRQKFCGCEYSIKETYEK